LICYRRRWIFKTFKYVIAIKQKKKIDEVPFGYLYQTFCATQDSTVCTRATPLPGESLGQLQTINLLKGKSKRWEKVDVYVIHISNETVDPALGDALADAPGNPNIAPRRFLNEAMSPLLALLNTRDARGHWSRESLAWQVEDGHYLPFGLCRSSRNAPLGWVLSGSTRVRMERQVNADACGKGLDNKASLTTIGGHFGVPKF